jgi:hypothetical protein
VSVGVPAGVPAGVLGGGPGGEVIFPSIVFNLFLGNCFSSKTSRTIAVLFSLLPTGALPCLFPTTGVFGGVPGGAMSAATDVIGVVEV